MKPAFLIAGTHSGSGKTTITLGIMAALRQRGMIVQPFKCGPDFIDPTLHSLVTGRLSRNLDLWMCGDSFVKASFFNKADNADISVVEGVMGLFDGGKSSSASLAKSLGLPVVLVVDASATAESMAAVVKGFESLDKDLELAGVILNRVGSARHLELLTTAINKHCKTKILGHMPRDVNFSVPERHLGLHMASDCPISPEALNKLAAAITDNIDLDELSRMTVAGGWEQYLSEKSNSEGETPFLEEKIRIGVARDRAFCFYYEDNLDLLRNAGAEIVEFSPLEDESLPDDLAAIYLGGGYPELYAESLSSNTKMLAEIKAWSMVGKPIYAECGGFMYLTEGITIAEDAFFPMAGVFPVKSRMKKGLAALGYLQAQLTETSMFGAKGFELRGHEFHYSEIEEMPDSVVRSYEFADGRREGFKFNNTLGSYLHIHFGATPEAAINFVRSLQEQV